MRLAERVLRQREQVRLVLLLRGGEGAVPQVPGHAGLRAVPRDLRLPGSGVH